MTEANPVRLGITNVGVLALDASNYVSSMETGHVFVPKTPEIFTYDADGNLLSDRRWNYTWDADNWLVKMESRPDTPQGSWRRIEWTYDALGRRIQQVTLIWTNNAWFLVENLKFVSDPMLFGRQIVDLNGTNNTLVKSYAWGLDLSGTMAGAGGVGGLAWVTLHTASGSASGTHFTCYDGNGNIVALVSATTGDVTARYEYGSFGEPIHVTGPAASLNPFRFSTKRTENNTDLVLYEYRAYSQSLGRWLSRDLIVEKGGLNVYAFVRNNTVNLSDYLGMAAKGCTEAIGKNGKPRIIFETAPPKGGWKPIFEFGELLGSGQAQMLFKIYIKWEAAVAVLCVCPNSCGIRYGTRIKEDEEQGNWLVYDPTKLPDRNFPVPKNASSLKMAIEEIFIDEIINYFIGDLPIPANDKETESILKAIEDLKNRGPKYPWEGDWKGGRSPCDG